MPHAAICVCEEGGAGKGAGGGARVGGAGGGGGYTVYCFCATVRMLVHPLSYVFVLAGDKHCVLDFRAYMLKGPATFRST